MVCFRRLRLRSICILPVWLLWFLTFCGALQSTTLKVSESSVPIYLREDSESRKTVAAEETVIRFGPSSTWNASTRAGTSLGGTWAGVIDPSTGTASGSWTLRDGAGRVLLRGTWSAAKSAREWRGSWRALLQLGGENI